MVTAAPTTVPPAVIPPVVFNCSFPKSIVPLEDTIEPFEIVISPISAEVLTSIVVKLDRLASILIVNVSGDDTIASKFVPVLTVNVLPEATACVFVPSVNVKPAAAIAIALISFTAPITVVADNELSSVAMSPKSLEARALNSVLNLSKLSVVDTCLTAI